MPSQPAVCKGSLVNKAILVPLALVLSVTMPWVITPLLMLGGAYLCFEGAEKVIEKISPHEEETLAEEVAELTSAEHEQVMVKGAVRTDFILSAEIMAIALNEVKQLAETSVWLEAATLAVVAVAITIAVYGVVGLIVKMDDIGLNMAQRKLGATRAIGRAMVRGMPKLLAALSTIGTAAMLWVGGQIIIHGFHVHPAEYLGLHEGALAWFVDAALCGVLQAGQCRSEPSKVWPLYTSAGSCWS